MRFIFFWLLTPVAKLLRLLRIDPLKRRAEPKAKTYWRARR